MSAWAKAALVSCGANRPTIPRTLASFRSKLGCHLLQSVQIHARQPDRVDVVCVVMMRLKPPLFLLICAMLPTKRLAKDRVLRSPCQCFRKLSNNIVIIMLTKDEHQLAADWSGRDDPDDPHNWALPKKLYHTFIPTSIAFLW